MMELTGDWVVKPTDHPLISFGVILIVFMRHVRSLLTSKFKSFFDI